MNLEGYPVIRFNFNPSELTSAEIVNAVPENVKLSDDNEYEVGDNVVIRLGDGVGAFDSSLYSDMLQEVWLNGDMLTEEGDNGYGGDYQYNHDNDTLTIYGKMFPKAAEGITVKLVAKEYAEKTFTFDVVAETFVDAPAIVAVAEGTYDTTDDVKLILGTSADDAYGRSVTSITVNGKDVGKPFFSYHYHTIYAYNADWVVGENTIVIKAEGYNDKTITLNIDEYRSSFPSYSVYLIDEYGEKMGDGKSTTIREGENVRILLNDSTYKGKVEQIKIGENAATDLIVKSMEITNSWGGKETAYYVEVPTLTASSTAYEVTLIAEGYHDGTFSLSVVESSAELPVPSFVAVEDASVEVGQALEVVVIATDDETYYKELTEIVVTPKNGGNAVKTMDRDAIEAARSGFFGDYHINLSELPVGQYDITLTATGYAEITLTAEVTKKVPGMYDNKPTLVDADLKTIEDEFVTKGSTVYLKVGSEDYTGKMGNFVTDNNGTIFINGTDKTADITYTAIAGSYYDTNVVDLTSLLQEGNNNVTVTNENFVDVVFSIKVMSEGDGLPAPSNIVPESNEEGIEVVVYNAWLLSHGGDEHESFGNAITEITLNGKTLNLSDLYSNGNTEKTVNIKTTTEGYIAGDENTIVIKATGYDDLTLTVEALASTVTKIVEFQLP